MDLTTRRLPLSPFTLLSAFLPLGRVPCFPFCVRPNHSYYVPDLRVSFLCRLSVRLAIRVSSPLYIYTRVLGHTVAFIHMCVFFAA